MTRDIDTPKMLGGARHRRARSLVTVLTLSLLFPVGLQVPVAQAKEGGLGRPGVPDSRVSKVKVVDELGAKKARDQVARDRKANDEQARRAGEEQRAAAWPTPGTAKVRLATGSVKAAAGGLPLALAPAAAAKDRAGTGNAAAKDRAATENGTETEAVAQAGTTATVTVLDRKAADRLGILGVVLTATAETEGRAEVSLGYGDFASAVGGGWAQRLRLVQLPACALTTPDKAECRKQTPLPSDNNTRDQTVTAPVTLAESGGLAPQTTSATSGATVLALTAAGTGDGESANGSGDYSATPLAESSSWEAGGSSGSFTWKYDFTMPPAAAGAVPPLGISYDSGSVDGRTAATNNQGSAVGEGFSLTESYIERSYGSCDDDGHADVFDRCWKYDNARLILNGKSSLLVKDNTTGHWKLQGDDASKVTRSTSTTNENGDNDGEHWTVVTGDGTTYTFGLNKLDGATTQRTNSTWTVPVFGDDSGEPGYSAGTTFADRSLTQAWRWNLDLVEDTSGNAATYWYTKEANYYKKNKATTANASYTRGGYLREIKYGLRKGALFTDDADAKVTFTHAERCTVADCTSLTKETADNWPDVPFDAICSSGESDTDCLAVGPSFFSRKRVTGIDTFSWNATTSVFDAVDSWDLTQKYIDGGDIGDTSDHVLTLQSIKRTAKADSTAIGLNPVSFTYHMRPNRVDGVDDILPLTRPRLSTFTSETGAITTVTTSAAECVRSEVTGAAEDTNTRNCYPQYWNINGAENASVDWFHKYRVLAVTVSDPAGQNEAVEHEYVYSGAAWHHSDSPFTPKDERTWSDWRGYRQVTAYTGASNTTRSKTVSLFMQGMNGDKTKDGTTKSVSLAPLATPALGLATLTDSDQYAGHLRQKITYNGATATSAESSEPWSSETARQSVPDAGDLVARFVRTKKQSTHTYLTVPQTWRSRTVVTDHDSYGMPYQAEDRGDDPKSGDETCTRTWYARNTGAGLIGLTSRERVVGRLCTVADADLSLPTSTATRGDVLSDTATAYDGAIWSTSMTPTKGLKTWTGRARSYSGTTPSWQKVTATTYDALGRPVRVIDAEDKAATTEYTPATAGPLTKTVTTNPKTHKVTSFLDPRRGLDLRIYDANLKKTELAYDALGRLTDVWLPNRNRAGGYSPNNRFTYQLSNTKQSWVSTAVLKSDGETYNTSFAVYDALLRPLQTQSPTPQGGRLLTDTRYDSRGLVYEKYEEIFDTTSAPNGTYARAEYGQAPKQTATVYDGAGRATTGTLYLYGNRQWSTTAGYTGDSAAVTALEGGSATRTITDARGRTVETREYAGVSPADSGFGGSLGASYTSTKFDHSLDDKQTSVTGPDGAKWTYTYDLFGRQVSATDPDKGSATMGYDAFDRVIKSTDSRGKSVLTGYDELGRPVGTWSGSKTDATQLTGYTYDTILKGQPSTSTRYVGGRLGQAYTNAVTSYDSLSRPTATQLQLPATDPLVKAGAPAAIDFDSYYGIDGNLRTSTEPALGGLPKEVVDYGYTSFGQVTSITGSTGYLLAADYSALGQAQQYVLGTGNTEAFKKTYVTNTFEEGTGRLTRSHVTDQTHPYMLQDLNYSYDQAGNVKAIADPTNLGGTSAAETQCFAYDGHQRLTEAWTPSTQNCADARNASSLSGPAPYWTSYSYTTAGQRKTETQHVGTGDSTTTYCYTDANQSHTLRHTTKNGDCATVGSRYVYDATGNTTERPGKTTTQDLTWSEDGRLATATEGGQATGYLYDADGKLLIRTTGNGERVLYAGATELHLKSNGTTWAQRHYASGSLTVAVRSNESGTNKLCYLAGDDHGTQSLAVSADSAQTVTKRRMTPFGAERGTISGGAWPDDKGFLGKTNDTTTGLTHVDAREYDPGIGQFISVDAVINTDAAQSLNGYSYANNSPVTLSDPTGLDPCGGLPCGRPGDDCAVVYCNGPNGGGDVAHLTGGGGNSNSDSGTSSSSSGDLVDLVVVDYRRGGPVPVIIQVTADDPRYIFQQAYLAAEAKRQLCERDPVNDACIDWDQIMDVWEGVNSGSIHPCTAGIDSSGQCRRMGDSYSQSVAPWLSDAMAQGTYGGGYCFVICLGATRAGDGKINANIGAIGFGGRGHAGGFATAPSSEQSWFSMQGCASLGHGVCGVVGTRSDPDLGTMSPDQASTDDYWYGVNYAPGAGWFAGLNISIPLG